MEQTTTTESLAWTLLVFVLIMAGIIVTGSHRSKPAAYDAWFSRQPPGVQERMSRRAALLPDGKASWAWYTRRYKVEPLYAPQMSDQAELRWLLRYGDPQYRDFAVLQINEMRSR